MSGTYLDRIVADVRARRAAVPRADDAPADLGVTTRTPLSLRGTILACRDAGELAVIAELKRRSPSVGAIDLDVDPAARAAAYEAAGSAGISVLTEPDHFGGSLDDLVTARAAAARTPILRKDFVVDSGQLDEARTAGADAVLLIAALHAGESLAELVSHAQRIGLEVLLEVHDEPELERALATPGTLIGINNRDLRSFHVDLAVTERLAPLVPRDRIIVAESGVRTVADAARLRAVGVDAVLVGETLMRAREPGTVLRALATATSATSEPAGAAP